jgi:hypothetical protein
MKFALAIHETRGDINPASPSSLSFGAEATNCARRSRPTRLTSSSRPGLRRSPTGRIRTSADLVEEKTRLRRDG